MTLSRQCELLALPRSTAYYRAVGASAENLALMRRIDEQYLATPFYGSRRMADLLGVNRKRVQRLMRQMGIEAIYPRRRTTWPGVGHKIYPYLLRNVAIVRPDQAWSTDITYIPLRRGFLYLTAIMDWFSRHVLAWRLSNTLTGDFCIEALEEALQLATPEIFNSDQGCQFTAAAFTERLERRGIAISMDGRGRLGQRVHRTTVAKRQVRGSLLARLRRRLGGRRATGGVLPVLCDRAPAPSPRLPDPRRGVRPAELKPQEALGR